MAAALVVGAGAGAAYGFFAASGSGSNVATVGTVQAVTVETASGTPSSLLIPGGPATDLLLSVDNPNSFAVVLTGISQNLSGTITVSNEIGTCTTTGVSVSTLGSLDITLDPGTHTVDIPNAASMSTSSDSGCQNGSFQIPVNLTVEKP